MKAQYYKNDEYAYSEVFWGKDKDRAYEHEADTMAIRDAVQGASEWIVDLGGGFGRLVPTLRGRAKNIVIVDASLDLLRDAKAHYGSDPSVRYVRANAYHLPFRDASIERAICMRVMHHIEEPDPFFIEINRVIRDAFYLEFPNKRHLLQQMRFYFRNDRSMNIRSSKPEMRDGMFLNFSLQYIRNHLLRTTVFSIERISGLSFLRQERIKKLPVRMLLAIEHALQRCTFLAEWSPSILLSLRKKPDAAHQAIRTLEDMLACPCCLAPLRYASASAMCERGHSFRCTDDIWDFFIE
ncbi:MAG: hypothetical protein JWL88_517 [Parcubacteria group bacterium]|nr:hypothetical protein [Parcubacteria group bacterium]